ncbi:MAG: tautomerase family protein [Thermoplasmata archaeon]
MPVVLVNMYAGRGVDAKRRIVEGITKVFEAENVPRDAVTVILNEIPRENWGDAGKLASDRS